MGASDRAQRIMREAAAEAVHIAAEDLLGRAQRDAPIDTGRLRASGHLVPDHGVELLPTGVQVRVTFDMPYSAVQETRTDFAHPHGGRAGYLGSNLKAMAGRYEAAIGANVKRRLTQHG